MRRGRKRVGFDIVVRMPEVIGREEDEQREEDKEHAQPEHVFHCVIGMERDDILFTLGVDTDRVVRSMYVQRPDMHHHDTDDHERHQVMQAEEAGQGRVIDRKTAPEQRHDIVTNQWNGREQVGDNGRAPEAHLAPRQHVAHECGRHHQQHDDNAQDPQNLARRFV